MTRIRPKVPRLQTYRPKHTRCPVESSLDDACYRWPRPEQLVAFARLYVVSNLRCAL
jgi:hypothetical protein